MTAIACLVSSCQGLVEPDGCGCLSVESVEDLCHGRTGDETLQFAPQVLLQRLARGLGAAEEFSVDVVGHISDEHIRHACSMQALGFFGKHVVLSRFFSYDGLSSTPLCRRPWHEHAAVV
jgi:hypothetical protein